MSASHLSAQLLRLVVDGELPPKALLRMMLEHLLQLCPRCAESWQEFKQTDPLAARRFGQLSSPPPAAPGGDYDDAFSKAAALLTAHAAHRQADAAADEVGGDGGPGDGEQPAVVVSAVHSSLARSDRADAEELRDAEALLALPAGERRPAFDAAPGRFHGRALVELLVAESLRRVRNRPGEALELSELAGEALERTPQAAGEPAAGERPAWARALAVRTVACAANALRVAGELRAADAGLRRARALLAHYPLNDSPLHAEVSSLEASLRLDQRRFAEADALLDRAAFLYREAGDGAGVAKVRVQQGTVLRQRGEVEAAVATLREAVQLAEAVAAGDPGDRLRRDALANLALALCDRDDYAAARAVLAAHEALFDGARDEWTTLRRRWLEGRIAAGFGDEEAAEAALSAVRRGFLDRGEGLNAALVSLDLAAVHAAAGRGSQLRRLAAEMGAVFAARDVGREAVAALALFQRSVAAENVDREVIRALRRQLQRARFPAATPAERQLPC